MFRLKVTISSLLILVFATNGAGMQNDKSKTPAQAIPTETRVYIRRQCLLGESKVLPSEGSQAGPEVFAAIAAIFLPLLIEKLLGGVAGALKKAGSEETLKSAGHLPTYLYRVTRDKKLIVNPHLQCVIVVRGQFSAPDPETEPEQIKFSEEGVFKDATEADESKRIKRLNENGIAVKEIAALYEAEIKLADDGTALRYQGKFLEVRRFQGGRSSETRGMVVSIGISGAGEKEGEPVLSLALMNLGEVTVHTDKKKEKSTFTVVGPDDLRRKRSSWLGGLAISKASLKAIEKLEFPKTKPGDAGHRTFFGVMPVTIEGIFIETENGNRALKFIGEVLDATKGDVTKAVSGEILKDREKEAAEAADAQEKLRQEERVAWGEYLEAKVDAAKAATAEEKEFRNFEANRKKALWCAKYLALEKVGQAPSGRQCTNEDLKQ